MKESDEEAVKLLRKALKESKLSGKNQDASATEEKLKKTTELLHRLISVFDPNLRTSPPSPVTELSSLIKNTKDELEKIIKRQDAVDGGSSAKGIVSTAGKIIQGICVKVTPFLKVFLSVAVQGSAVLSKMSFDLTIRYQSLIPMASCAAVSRC
jgi:hypothetical protein